MKYYLIFDFRRSEEYKKAVHVLKMNNFETSIVAAFQYRIKMLVTDAEETMGVVYSVYDTLISRIIKSKIREDIKSDHIIGYKSHLMYQFDDLETTGYLFRVPTRQELDHLAEISECFILVNNDRKIMWTSDNKDYLNEELFNVV